MPLFQAERCRALAVECRQLALAAESKIEKTFLTNLAFSWNRLANQTDRYVEFLKTLTSEKEYQPSKELTLFCKATAAVILFCLTGLIREIGDGRGGQAT